MDDLHFARLHAAIVAWVACNPGLGEDALLERFWGYPTCLVRGMLVTMVAEGTLRRTQLARPPKRPFGGDCPPAPPTHFFLGPRGRSLAEHDDVARSGAR